MKKHLEHLDQHVCSIDDALPAFDSIANRLREMSMAAFLMNQSA